MINSKVRSELMTVLDMERYKQWSETEYKFDRNTALKFKDLTDKPNIIIIGDYDVDGLMGTYEAAMLCRRLHPESKVRCIIPRRFSDGYGISQHIISQVLKDYTAKDTCVVTVDNGISQFGLDKLHDKGFTIVLTDHHIAQEQLPKCDLLINPHVTTDIFDYHDYCGAGVIYKIAEALIGNQDILDKEFLPFAGIATKADVVPLTGDNWKILRRLTEEVHVPEFLNFCKKEATFADEDDIGFYIAPALNSAGRLLDEGGLFTLDYLVNPTKEKFDKITALNTERKTKTDTYQKIAEQYIETHNLTERCPIIVDIPDIPEGILGIVAGNLVKKYNRPAICYSNGKASCRSTDILNIFDYLQENKDCLKAFGGHPLAAGFSATPEGISELQKRTKVIKVSKRPHWDAQVSNTDIVDTYEYIRQAKPFGCDNEAPVFRIDVDFTKPKNQDNVKYLGKDSEHLSITNPDGSKTMHFYHCDNKKQPIGISKAERFSGLGHLSVNYFRGTETVQLVLDEVYDALDDTGHTERQFRSL